MSLIVPRLYRASRLATRTAAASFRLFSTHPEYSNIIVTNPSPAVSLITLNRPKALNGTPNLFTSARKRHPDIPWRVALSGALFTELNSALDILSADDDVRAVVLTGSTKAFAAGADIKEMKDKEFAEVYSGDFLGHWTQISAFRKPIVAAVSGYALGGGCELAMMCDIILASPTAVFGQPEINLGVIPGAGGTQRLTHAIGKSRAMEIVLTGKNFTGAEAAEWGLISRVVEGDVVEEAVKVATKIGSLGRVAVQAAKEGVNAAYELNLKDGLHFERRLFHMLFATKDQKVGMGAFAAKQKPTWTHQ
ncbi:enoyl-CoA hydratase, partial [Phenoliferia sp. Uapishka_3]